MRVRIEVAALVVLIAGTALGVALSGDLSRITPRGYALLAISTVALAWSVLAGAWALRVPLGPDPVTFLCALLVGIPAFAAVLVITGAWKWFLAIAATSVVVEQAARGVRRLIRRRHREPAS